MSNLDGASVLVTGATGGLGAPLCALLARAGARLTVVGRDPDRLRACAPDAVHVVGDLRRADLAPRAVEAAIDAYQQLDGVVVASGIVAFGAADALGDDVLVELFTVNTLAPMRLLRAAVPALIDSSRQPFVVNLSAVVAETPMPGMAAYSASKAALSAFDAAAARELRRRGIRVVDVRPPHTETGLASRPVAGEAPTLPVGRAPDVVARRIVDAIVNDEREVPAAAF
jgi:cyclic-di-GMP-binding biofilm dispersal mediator protein